MLEGELLLLVLTSIAAGFGLGYWRSGARQDADAGREHYVRGLNFLINEQPDQAIDAFIDGLDVNVHTLETHLALGNQVRRRGEVDRAIKIHQNLLARPGLPRAQLQQVQLELARDYIKSGLLDRAENLLMELVPQAEPSIRATSLRHLIEIFQDEKEWDKAISCVLQLAGRRFGRVDEGWRSVLAHYHCENAEVALAQGEYLAARRHLQRSLAVDRGAVRANLILAEIEYRQAQYCQVLTILRQIIVQDPDFIPEMLPLYRKACLALGQMGDFTQFLQELYRQYPLASIVIALSERLVEEQGLEAALELLGSEMRRRPSLVIAEAWLGWRQIQECGSRSVDVINPRIESPKRGISKIESPKIENHKVDGPGVDSPGLNNIVPLYSLLGKLHQARPSHRCCRCGFSGQQLHWLCPGCKSWGAIKPVKGVEGE